MRWGDRALCLVLRPLCPWPFADGTAHGPSAKHCGRRMRRCVMEDFAPLLERAFSLDPGEQEYTIEAITGEVPDFVRGTYYLNGPARFARAGLQYRHWLDGDGMVCALRFGRGAARFTCRYVRGPKFMAEEIAGRPKRREIGRAHV